MYVNCVYCGHRYGPGETTPVSMADALTAHVEQCPQHPMMAMRTALERYARHASWCPIEEHGEPLCACGWEALRRERRAAIAPYLCLLARVDDAAPLMNAPGRRTP